MSVQKIDEILTLTRVQLLRTPFLCVGDQLANNAVLTPQRAASRDDPVGHELEPNVFRFKGLLRVCERNSCPHQDG